MAPRPPASLWHLAILLTAFILATVFVREDNPTRIGSGANLLSYLRPANRARVATEIPSPSAPSHPIGACHPDTLYGSDTRQREEHQKLLQRMQRGKGGELETDSPRHRLLKALHGFCRYRRTAEAELDKIQSSFESYISKDKRQLINSAVGYDTKIQRTRQLIWQNDKVAQAIVDCGLEFYEIGFAELISYVREAEAAGTSVDRVSVAQTLKHFVRDWAVDGEHERSPMFPQILETLDKLFPRPGRDKIRVLVPGSGLNRLAHDIAGLGDFEVTANEWSSYMNIAYRYVTSLRQPNSTVIHPFLDWWSHQPTTSELHRRVTFPDIPVDASAALLVEGDFTTAFKGRDDTGHYDAVVTFFFIDTARSLLSYLETIHRLLKPGGIWINTGPLLYGSSPFLQLSLDEVIDLSERIGFEFLETDSRFGNFSLPGGKGWVRQKEAPYGFQRQALWKNAYWAAHWVARH